jgi:uncharacterized protein YkwD
MVCAATIAATLGGHTAMANGDKQPGQPAQAPAGCPMGFSDVQPTDYFYEPVRYLYCDGAINGYSDNTFRPYNVTTRGQISKIVVMAQGFPLNTSGGPHFSDVPANNPFYAYIETAYLRGVISGYNDGTFRPNLTITRGQLAKVVVTAKSWPLTSPVRPTFSDVPANNPFYAYVETAVARGAITGYNDGSFRLGSSATRGQISKIFYYADNGFQLTAQEQQTVDLINQRRAAMGLGALRVNIPLTNAARRHSADIGPLGLCQHNGTDGTSPWDRIAQAGYQGSAMGEVVGCGYTTPLGVVDGWWGSPGHYDILTDPNANDIGCGWYLSPTLIGTQTCDTGHSN